MAHELEHKSYYLKERADIHMANLVRDPRYCKLKGLDCLCLILQRFSRYTHFCLAKYGETPTVILEAPSLSLPSFSPFSHGKNLLCLVEIQGYGLCCF